LIVCDDVENERWVESERNRMQLREWFHGTLVPAGDERTNVVHLATALHPNSLGLELARNPGWRSRVFRALVKEPEERELWERWEELWRGAEGPAGARRFYEEHREAMTRGAEVLWPEAEDLEALMRFRMEQGAGAFAREKQNAPEEALGAEWPGRCFAEETWVEGWPNEAVVRAIGVDPSVGGTGRRGDATAIVLIAVDAEGVIYAGADLQRRPAGEIAAEVAALAAAFRAELIAVETNLFQQLLGDALERALAGAGLWNVAVLRIENRERKSVRIRRLGHYLAAGRMRWVRSMRGTEALVRQLREFPGGAHDDGPDALEMAVRAAGEWCRER
jgi:predicted phage terminase large subunit-like protein